MPNCALCAKAFKTRGTLAKHQRLYHEGRSIDGAVPAASFTLTFFVNQVHQTLSCPVCSFSRDRCRSVKPIATHFMKQHPRFQLFVSYHCQWCNGYIDPSEIRVHAHAHLEHLALGQPFSPPHPVINPADNSLSFVDDNGQDVDEEQACIVIIPETQPDPLPASISVHVDDRDIENIVNVHPSTTSPSAVVIPPSYKEILLRTSSPIPDTFSNDMVLPSPPSPVFFDPSASTSDDKPLVVSSQSPVGPMVPPREISVPSEPVSDVNATCSGSSVSVGTLDFVSSVNTPVTPSSSYSDPDPSTPQLSKPLVNESSPPVSATSPLSVSPNDSPAERRLLLGSSSPIPDDVPEPAILTRKAASPSTKTLEPNDLRHRLMNAMVSSDSDNSLGRSGVRDTDSNDERQRYLVDCNKALLVMKNVCLDDDGSPDNSQSPSSENFVAAGEKVADERRVVLVKEPVVIPSTMCDTREIVVTSALASSMDSGKQRAEQNRLNALAILRETFSTNRLPPSTVPARPSTSASRANNSNASFEITSVVQVRQDNAVAPPPPVTKRRHVFLKDKDKNSSVNQATTSDLITAALRKLRPRPKSDSDDDSCFDPSTPDGDDVDDLIPSTQPRPPRPPVMLPPARANPRSTPPPDAGSDDHADLDEDDVDAFNNSQELPVESDDQRRLVEFRERWIQVFSEDLSWPDFSLRCAEFATETKELASELSRPASMRNKQSVDGHPAPPPPPPRRPPMGRPVKRFDPVAARKIQGLYRHSKKRAARTLLNDNSVQYSGSVEDATTYFMGVFDEKFANANVLGEGLNTYVKSAKDHELTKSLYDEISESEVATKLRSAANTAPGADRCEYAHLKRVDPNGKILAVIFNHCQRQKDVPAAWKLATTVLIYKKGDDSDVSNFRPISLMSVIYKLFMGILAKRLTWWSIETGVLSDEQKSARPSEGCYEHTYLLKSLVADARRRKQKLYLAWLDIRNAFGSVPHNTIRSTLRHIGVPVDMITLIMNAYTGATSIIRTPQGTTEPIPLRAGVKQGCPMSPILFNICIELILRMVKAKAAKLKSGVCKYHDATISCLAYADDLVIIARSSTALQKLLYEASDGATILGLSFRPDKCASLSLVTDGRRTVRTEVIDFYIQGERFPALVNEESYRYLGVPIGLVHNIDDIPNIVPRLIRDLEAVRSSLLAPWQKLDAIRTFIQPCLTYALRAGNPLKKSLHEYRALLLKAVRDICNLPTRASASYIFAGKSAGGLAFQDPTVESDLQAIVQAIRMLSSSDDKVTTIAKAELKKFVRNTTQSAPTAELISKYLSAVSDPRLDKLSYSTHSSLWSRVRLACRRQRVTFVFSDTNPPHVSADESEGILSKQISVFLHRLVQQRSASDLMSLADQGKVARCMAGDQYGNGSSWHMNGLNIRFKDWRFIHRARLNLLPLNANKSLFSRTDPTCRHCNHPETLPHVVCHCRPQMTQIRDRHNKIVDRITNAVRFGEIRTDRAVKESGLRLRPDIVVKEENEVLIVDVTCPFDNDVNALSDAAEHKFLKYQPLKEHFIARGFKCEIYPFVIGALGSWYKKNELLCSKLGMTRRYKSLFRKLCCSDAIQGSCHIYRLHLGWDDATPEPVVASSSAS